MTKSNASSVLATLLDKFVVHSSEIVLGMTCIVTGFVIALLLKSVAHRYFEKRPPLASSPGLENVLSADHLAHLSLWGGRIVFWLTLMVFFIGASELFGLRILSVWVQSVATYFPNVLAAAMVIVLGNMTAKLLRSFVLRSGATAGLENVQVVGYLIYAMTITVTILIAVKQVGVEIQFLTSVLLLVLGCLLFGGALSFGLGSSPIVTNILAGFYARKLLSPGTNVKFEGGEGKIVKCTPTSFVLANGSKTFIVPARFFNDAIVEKEDH